MSRPLRYIVPGGLYHVTARGNERREIVRDDADRRAFVRRLADVVLASQWLLHNWMLMGNHLHLVVETPIPNLSDGMRNLLSPFARRFNLVHDRVGHLFHHRFKARLVERETHLLNLMRYVPLNPVRAGLVSSPAQWPWGSYLATAGYEPAPPWLEVGWTLAQFDPTDRRRAQQLYRRFVSAPQDPEYDPHAAAVGGWILGSPAFCERVQTWLDERARSREHPRKERWIALPSLERLLMVMAREVPGFEASIGRWSHGPARKLIADLGHDACGVSFVRLAEFLGTTPWGASKLRVRSRELEQTDPTYAELLRRIRKALEE